MADYSIKPIRAGVLPADRWEDVTDEMIQKIDNLLESHMYDDVEYITGITGDIYNGELCVYIIVRDEKYINLLPGAIDGMRVMASVGEFTRH